MDARSYIYNSVQVYNMLMWSFIFILNSLQPTTSTEGPASEFVAELVRTWFSWNRFYKSPPQDTTLRLTDTWSLEDPL